MREVLIRRKNHRQGRWLGILTILLVVGAGRLVHAQGVNIPSKRWGIGFGNTKEFTGIRFNYRDSRVRRITGINVTLWSPREDNQQSMINGLSFGLMPGGGTMNGVQLGIFGAGAEKSANGISIGLLGVGAGEDLNGINIGGLGCGAGGNVWGLNIGGLGIGAGGDLKGITIGGLGAGAGGSMTGFNFGVLGVGAGENLSGINIGGVGAGAGEMMRGLTICGLGAGAPKVRGVTIAGGAAGGIDLRGITIALGTILVKGDEGSDGLFSGFGFSAFNYIRGTQKGVTIGIVNYAYRLKGIQIGLVNIVRDGPGPKMLPLINARF